MLHLSRPVTGGVFALCTPPLGLGPSCGAAPPVSSPLHCAERGLDDTCHTLVPTARWERETSRGDFLHRGGVCVWKLLSRVARSEVPPAPRV